MRSNVKNEPIIVLADTDLSHIDFHQQVLSENGFWLRSVATPEKLFTILEQHPVNVLVMSIEFGKKGDLTLEEQLAKIRTFPTCKDARVIISSNEFSIEERDHVYNAGACEYLVYPLTYEELYLKINTHLVAGARKGTPNALSRSFNVLTEVNHSIFPKLAAASSASHLLKQTSLSTKQAVYVDSIHRSMLQASLLTDNLVDFEEMCADHFVVENTPFDLDQLLVSVSEYLVSEAETREVELLFEIPMDVPRSLIGDPDRLRRVLINLVTEAINIGAGYSIILSISANRLTQNAVGLEFAIHEKLIGDSQSTGMLEELAERALMAKSEVDESLALLNACFLIESMGGSIAAVNPDTDSGLLFHLDMTVSAEVKSKSFAVPVDLRRLRILVVDDNPSSIAVHCAIIGSLGFSYAAASDVDEAFDAIVTARESVDENEFDLVLLDWHMPGQKGHHLLEKFADNLGEGKSPIIIVVSAFDKAKIEQEKGRGTINGFLHKPISASVLFDTIMNVMGQNLPKTHQRIVNAKQSGSVVVNGGGKRILIVDDMPINQQIAKEILISQSFHVDVAQNGRQAVEMVCPAPELYDAILMDLEMPNMNGFEATRLIRETVDSRRLPIFAVTAHTMAADRKRCMDCGMTGHIAKPVDADTLIETLALHLGLVMTTTNPSLRPAIEDIEDAADQDNSYQYVDYESGVKRVMGNEALYLKLLGDFEQQSKVLRKSVEDAVFNKDFKAAAEHAHSLAGSAGNLSVMALRRSAKELQAILPTGVDYKDLLSKFYLDVENATNEIQGILKYKAPGSRATDPDEKVIKHSAAKNRDKSGVETAPQPDSVSIRLMVLKKQIVSHDLLAIDTYHKLLIEFCDMATELKPVGDKIINLDYKEALIELDAVMARLEKNRKTSGAK